MVFGEIGGSIYTNYRRLRYRKMGKRAKLGNNFPPARWAWSQNSQAAPKSTKTSARWKRAPKRVECVEPLSDRSQFSTEISNWFSIPSIDNLSHTTSCAGSALYAIPSISISSPILDPVWYRDLPKKENLKQGLIPIPKHDPMPELRALSISSAVSEELLETLLSLSLLRAGRPQQKIFRQRETCAKSAPVSPSSDAKDSSLCVRVRA